MRYPLVILLLLSSALLLPGDARLQIASARSGGAEATQVARIISSNSEQLQFILEVPEPEIRADGTVYVKGLQTTHGAPGAPALPSFVTFVALPPGANSSVHVLTGGQPERRTAPRIQPIPTASNSGAGEEREELLALSGSPMRIETPEVYSKDAFYPGVRFQSSEPMYFRDLRVVRLELYPLQYNPVRGTVEYTTQLQVTVRFEGGQVTASSPIAGSQNYLDTIAPLVLNFDQGLEWRSMPPDSFTAEGMAFPTNKDTFKIAVDEDGIYELTYDHLAAAGMSVDEVNPLTFEMMYRGEPVAYQFVGNGNTVFEQGEMIRFYGWKFDGSRLERQFLTANVFWLWADGNPRSISTYNVAPGSDVAASYRATVTREPEVAFTHVWTDNWEDSPNEPDAWVWERVQKTVDDWPVIEHVHEITTSSPSNAGAPALVTVEILSRENRPDHDVEIYLNGNAASSGRLQWTGARSVNVTMTVPTNQLQDGPNDVHIVYHTPVTTTSSASSTPALYYMNRITVDYDRQFTAEEEQLEFRDGNGGSTYHVAGFTNAGALVWEISDRLNPRSVTNVNVTGSNPYTYSFSGAAGNAAFIATHSDNARQPLSINKYVGPDLDPAQGASWLAVTHANFINQARNLAAHREEWLHGGHSTHVVDIRHVINQYGYGLPLPEAIQNYVKHTLANWPVAPEHLLLFGDGHINPRQIPCNPGNTQCSHWTTETNFVLTDIVFTDQFVGLNASDYRFSLLVGDDLLPDIAVGRLAVRSTAEAQNIVEKIIDYERDRLIGGPWQRNVIFLADDPDQAGEFCAESTTVASELPAGYTSRIICLPSNSPQDVEATLAELHDAVNNPPESGASFLNYRGHGAVRSWAGNLVNLDFPGGPRTPWLNNEPLIILSMDCLDGHFAQPGYRALSEDFLALQTYGSVAHWSSSGYGYDYQHGPLHHSFYEGLFEQNLTAIGEAVNYAKVNYVLLALHPSQLYSFILQGDPAMNMIRPPLADSQDSLFLPVVSR